MMALRWIAIAACVLIVVIDWVQIYRCHRLEQGEEPTRCRICGKIIPKERSLCEDCEKEIDANVGTG